jgi:hypothetical protein
MEAPMIIVVGVILALLSALSIILLKLSSKEYPKEEVIRPKFEAGKVSYPHCTDPYEAEKPKRRYKKKRKKKPTVANNAQVEKRPVGRPRKSE